MLASLAAPTGDDIAVSALEDRVVSLVAEDTYLRGYDTNIPHGTNTVLRIKNESSSQVTGNDRNIYLRFDISALDDLEDMISTNAMLKIDLLNEGTTTNHNIYVAVIAEDAADELFDEDVLTSNNSDVWTDSDDTRVDFSKTYGGAPVGSFEISKSNNGQTMTFDDPKLLSAIRADTDGVLSLVLYRTIAHPYSDDFASKEYENRIPPRLEIMYRPRRTGTVIIVL
ncbi:MAG: DNRLRE domain-containing protein [Kiritimatiellae bacterium]|nr:DNRLRE domain-containing protein [Kiritimatiellia bacterium]